MTPTPSERSMNRLKEISAELEKMYREIDTPDHPTREAMIHRASVLTEEMAGLLRERVEKRIYGQDWD